MKVINVPAEEINIGPRRREDYGDLDGLAASIAKYGLFSPLIINNGTDLVAGERRFKACTEKLGWTEIPCRLYSDLTPEEKLEIELEENEQRKDLTPYEAAKQLLQRAEKIEEIISSHGEEKDSRGRKSQRSAPKKDIAQGLGVSVGKFVETEQYVKAVESHPDLKDVPQKQAISTAREREKPKLKSVSKKPAPYIPKPSKTSPLRDVQQFIHDVKQKGGAVSFIGAMRQTEQINFLDSMRNCRDELETFIGELQDYFDEQSAMAS